MAGEKVSCGTERVVRSGKDSAILPALVANHSATIGSSFQLTELAIIIWYHGNRVQTFPWTKTATVSSISFEAF